MFGNSRHLGGLNTTCEAKSREEAKEVRNALAFAFTVMLDGLRNSRAGVVAVGGNRLAQ